MASRGYEFRNADLLVAGFKGAPGKRTFYILMGDSSTVVRLWVQKEHLLTLSDAIDQALEEFREHNDHPMATPYSPNIDDSRVDSEINVGGLALAVDHERGQIGLFVYIIGSKESSPPSFRCWASPDMMNAFARQIDEVCAAGRPNCPLCAQPIDPTGHVCPRANGHHATLV